MTEQTANPSDSGNRRALMAIFVIPVVVFAISTLLYYLVQNEVIQLGTVNNGELVTPPLALTELPLQGLDGYEYDYAGDDPRWTFLVIGDSRCEGSCERMMYVARQSIVALGKKMNRVKLAYLTTAGGLDDALQMRIDKEYRGMELIRVAEPELAGLFADAKPQPHQPRTFFVVDPQGWLMMFYQVEDTGQDTLNTLGKAVVHDMKRLIK